MKARRNANKIFSIKNSKGSMVTNMEGIAGAFVDFYTELLGSTKEDRIHVCSNLVRKEPIVTEEQRNMLNEDFTEKEVKQVLWQIDGEKAPCPDGYGSNFFKDSWDIIIKDLEEGVLEFFKSRKMLKVINNTIITVIPKSSHAEAVGDYRPIVCCNTVYKVISKMLCNRLKVILPSIISENQSAFVAGRTIMQNILICQNLVRLYNRKAATRSCLIKIDLKKAYDSIEWDFVEEMLHALNFPMKFIRWIMECISTTQYVVAINGGLYGSIRGKRGLRQGDPISPLLFVICMEYFTIIMKLVAQ